MFLDDQYYEDGDKYNGENESKVNDAGRLFNHYLAQLLVSALPHLFRLAYQ
jgi:hypothetical protein